MGSASKSPDALSPRSDDSQENLSSETRSKLKDSLEDDNDALLQQMRLNIDSATALDASKEESEKTKSGKKH